MKRYFKVLGITTLITMISTSTKAQDDWKLPKVDDQIRIDYSSTPIKSKGKDICTYYKDPMAGYEVTTKLNSVLDDKGVKWFSDTRYQVSPILVEVPSNEAMMKNPMGFNSCSPDKADTVFGKLSISITKATVAFTASGVKRDFSSISCRYRIIMHPDNHYEIAFKGFSLTTMKISKGRIDQEEVLLDDVYNETDPTKAQKNFYKDIMFITKTYNDVLTNYFQKKVKAEF